MRLYTGLNHHAVFILFMSLGSLGFLSSCNRENIETKKSTLPLQQRNDGSPQPLPSGLPPEKKPEEPVREVPTPTPSPTPTPTQITQPKYKKCTGSSNTTQICNAVKIVSYRSPSGKISLSEDESKAMIDGVNKVWESCGIAYQIESYTLIDTKKENTPYDVDWQNDADSIRSKYEENDKLLIVSVGELSGSTIAVTQLPFNGPFGMLVDQTYSKNAFTVGHEFGHYLGLYHVNDNTNLMNPFIGSNTDGIYNSQCTTARSSNTKYWQKMIRK